MKTWQRIRSAGRRCGGPCGEVFAVGDAVMIYTIGRRELLRCERCEGSPAPPALPALIVEKPAVPQPLPFVRFTPDMLPLDWKQAAAQEREPGEEG